MFEHESLQPTANTASVTPPLVRRSILRFGALAAMGTGITLGGQIPATKADAAVEVLTPEAYVPLSAQDAALAPVPARVRSTLVQGTQAGHSWTDGNSQGGVTISNDTNEYLVGTQSIRRESNGTAGMSRLQVVGGTPTDFTDKHASLMLRVENLDKIKWLTVYAASGNLSNVHFKWDLKPPPGIGWFLADSRWTTITLNFSDAIKIGAPNLASITDWQVMAVDDNTGGSVKLNIAKVDWVPRTNRWPNGVWTLSMDDSFASQMPIVRYASQYGIRGTLYTIAELVDKQSFLTVTELRTAQDDLGWEVAGHSMTLSAHDATFSALTPAQLDNELSSLKMWLRTRGFVAANHLAYPKGIFNGAVLDAVKKHFPGSARGTFSSTTETAPPPERHILRARSLGQGRSLAQAKSDIDSAYESKGWLHNYGHQFNPTASSIAWATSDMKLLIDYAVAKGIGIATVGEVLSAQYL